MVRILLFGQPFLLSIPGSVLTDSLACREVLIPLPNEFDSCLWGGFRVRCSVALPLTPLRVVFH